MSAVILNTQNPLDKREPVCFQEWGMDPELPVILEAVLGVTRVHSLHHTSAATPQLRFTLKASILSSPPS